MVEHSPNITCLRFSYYNLLKRNQVYLLLQAYDHQLEELVLIRGHNSFDHKTDREWIQLLIKYGNLSRLHKLGLAVDTTESLKVICKKFPHLIVFFIRQNYLKVAINMLALAKLKHLQTLVFHFGNIDNGNWVPVKDWRHSLVGLHFRRFKVKNFNSTLDFLRNMVSLLRFTIKTYSQEELDFVCQNVSPEIEILKITMFETDDIFIYVVPTYTRFPDICRLKKLQTLKICHINPTTVDTLHLLDQKPLPSIRKLILRQLGEKDCPKLREFNSKINTVFPNFKNFLFIVPDFTAHFW